MKSLCKSSSLPHPADLRAPLLVAALSLALVLAAPAGAAEPLASITPGPVSFGFNGNGELGNGTTVSSTVGVPVGPLGTVTAVSAGGFHSLGLLNSGRVMSWGYDGYGELGNGTTGSSEVPVEVQDLSGVTAISAGEFHSLALVGRAGTVAAWGANNDGQLGNGTTTSSDIPVQVPGLSGVRSVSAGGCGPYPEGHSLALLDNGTVMAWGDNEYGQLGNGTTTNSDVPTEVPGLHEVVAISAGELFSLALLRNGRVMAWGRNNVGQLGGGTINPEITVPVEVTELSAVTAISAGGCGGSSEGHSLALLSNGTVMAWGANGYGELGNGTTADSDAPVRVAGLRNATAIATGTSHSVALLQNGTVMGWGGNYSGQLGDGSTTSTDVPVAAAELRSVTAISAGGYHTLALVGAPASPPAPPTPPTPPAPPAPPTPPAPPAGGTQPNVIIGVSDGSGWGPLDARRFLEGGLTSERLEASGSRSGLAESLANGFSNDTVIVGNTPDGQPLSAVNVPAWTASTLAQVTVGAGLGVTLFEVGNEMYLKGNGGGNGEQATYAEMYVSLAQAVRAAGLKVKLLFNSFGSHWIAGAVSAQPSLKTLIDGFTNHPYGLARENREGKWGPGAMEAMHAEAVSLGVVNTDFYVTEFGVEDGIGPKPQVGSSGPAQQAERIRAVYEELIGTGYVRGIWYYQTHDDSTGKWGLIEPQVNGSSPFIPREALGVIEKFAAAED
jgi:alpha-tubulin suppressor-like RCC1 family protein